MAAFIWLRRYCRMGLTIWHDAAVDCAAGRSLDPDKAGLPPDLRCQRRMRFSGNKSALWG